MYDRTASTSEIDDDWYDDSPDRLFYGHIGQWEEGQAPPVRVVGFKFEPPSGQLRLPGF